MHLSLLKTPKAKEILELLRHSEFCVGTVSCSPSRSPANPCLKCRPSKSMPSRRRVALKSEWREALRAAVRRVSHLRRQLGERVNAQPLRTSSQLKELV